MNDDIRVSTGFKSNTKRIKSQRRAGAEFVLAIIDLWGYAGRERPDGRLTNMDDEDISIASGWAGDPVEFVRLLREFRWVDVGDDGVLRLHDWSDHNPFAAKAQDRSDAQRLRVHRGRYCPVAKPRPENAGKKCSEPLCEFYQKAYQPTGGSTDGKPPNTSGATPYPSPVPVPKEEESLLSPPDGGNHRAKRRPRREYGPNDREMRAANFLLAAIRTHMPEHETPDMQMWADEFRKIFDIDKRDPETVKNVIDYATADDFWKSNVLSPSALRGKTRAKGDKFLTIVGKMRQSVPRQIEREEGLRGVAL